MFFKLFFLDKLTKSNFIFIVEEQILRLDKIKKY